MGQTVEVRSYFLLLMRQDIGMDQNVAALEKQSRESPMDKLLAQLLKSAREKRAQHQELMHLAEADLSKFDRELPDVMIRAYTKKCTGRRDLNRLAAREELTAKRNKLFLDTRAALALEYSKPTQ